MTPKDQVLGGEPEGPKQQQGMREVIAAGRMRAGGA